MGVFWTVWIVLVLILAGFSAWLGSRLRGSIWAIFIDSRNTWSLSQFQLVCWTFLGLPLIFATVIWRASDDASSAWDFEIPGQLLALMGISLGSAVASLAVKSTKNTNRSLEIGARPASTQNPPFADMFAVEEGTDALKNIDVTKFQNFFISLGLLASYLWIVVDAFASLPQGVKVPTSLPSFSQEMVGLLALSHGGYLVGKIPNRPGNPETAAAAAAAAAANASGVPAAAPVSPAIVNVARLQG
ncbi:MAG: hypothetical protein AB7Q42_02765 [Acidimicrobiia bacterium]